MQFKDYWKINLKAVFCGVAPGKLSASLGHYYSYPTNKFWPALFAAGFTPVQLNPRQDHLILKFGLGLTDLALDQAGADNRIEIQKQDLEKLIGKIKKHKPKALAFNGKRAAEILLHRKITGYGRQEEKLGQTLVWVLPSTSPAAGGYWDLKPWKNLSESVK